MTKPTQALHAIQALQSSLKRSNVNQPVHDAVTTFIKALQETDPDRVFTVADIGSWATEYVFLEGQDALPLEIFNAYSLGKYLKGHSEDLGIAPQGTYGNRQVWGLKSG